MNLEETELAKKFQERLLQLPKVLQDAINSTDIEKRLRALGEKHKLHVDQWDLLENEVKLALLGFQPAEDLEKNIKNEVGVSDEIAKTLTESISEMIFEPVRAELERQLDHPDAQAVKESGVEATRTQMLAENAGPAPVAPPPVAPATPPQAPPVERTVRAPISAAYKAGEASTVRASIEDDPYREPPK